MAVDLSASRSLAASAHLRQPCAAQCGHFALEGKSYCCDRCKHGGHTPECNAAHQETIKMHLDYGKDIEGRVDFSPIKGLNDKIDFESNKQWIRKCIDGMQKSKDLKEIVDIFSPPPEQLVAYVRGLVPVHRLSETVFKAVLRDGGLRSRAMQEEMRAGSPLDAAAARLRFHPRLGALMKPLKVRKRDMHLFPKAARPMLELHLSKHSDKDRQQVQARRDERIMALKRQFGDRPALDKAVAELQGLAKDVAEHTRDSADFDPGVGWAKDKELGTDKHVFSIIGANMGNGYGEVVLILKPSIMRHPDFNMTITAATSYVSKRTYFHRPWMAMGKVVGYVPASSGMHCDPDSDSDASVKDDGGADPDSLADVLRVLKDGKAVEYKEADMLKNFHQAKLHPCVADWERVTAWDLALQCRLFFMSKRKMDHWIDKYTESFRDEYIKNRLGGKTPTAEQVTFRVVKNWYTRVNSHGCIEGHLPQFVPLDFVETILMPKAMYGRMKGLLDGYKLADGRSLGSCVEVLPDKDYGTSVRRWQADYFSSRAAAPQHGQGAAIDSRAWCFGIEGLLRKEQFLPLRIPDSRSGFAIRFRAKGQHIRLVLTNQRVCFDSRPSNGSYHSYLIVIGEGHNTKTFVRSSNARGYAVELSRDQRADAMAIPTQYREYWLTFQAALGKLRLGVGGLDAAGRLPQVPLFEWVDSRPHQDLQYVAVSCHETPVDFSMFKLSDLPRQ